MGGAKTPPFFIMHNFINNVSIEGVVIDPPSQIQTSGNGIASSVLVWHTVHNQEMIFRVMSNSPETKGQIRRLDRGNLVTFYGQAMFLRRSKGQIQPFIILLADRLRLLDVDVSFGKNLLENADLSEVNELKVLKLPWEES